MRKTSLLVLAVLVGLLSLPTAAVVGAQQGQRSAQQPEFDVIEATIDDVHDALRRGEITCRELVLTYLHRIATYDKQGPSFHAVITMNPDALRLADAFDAADTPPDQWGELACIPVLLKDAMNTADNMPTTGGNLAMMGTWAPEDAFIVERMREEGAIIIAKANLDELTRGIHGASSLGGQTRNAYDTSRNPGGSSSGTGTGLAANYAVVGIGTDTCGSIRNPSSFNNLVGIRPTTGLVSRTGVMPNANTTDTAGPMARTVTDAAILLDVIAGVDPEDPASLEAEGNIPDTYTDSLNENGLRGKRIGVVRELFGTGPEATEVNAVLDEAIEKLRDLGAEVIDPLDAPNAEVMNFGEFTYWGNWEMRFQFEDYLADLGDAAPITTIEELAEIGSAVPRIDEGLQTMAEITSQDDPRYQDVINRGIPLAQEGVEEGIEENDLDAMLYPTVQVPPAPIGVTQAGSNCIWSALSGAPAITVPAGFTSDGLPVGMELIGLPWSEGTLIEIAYAYEQGTHHRRPTELAP